jgi:hypothetical protein
MSIGGIRSSTRQFTFQCFDTSINGKIAEFVAFCFRLRPLASLYGAEDNMCSKTETQSSSGRAAQLGKARDDIEG